MTLNSNLVIYLQKIVQGLIGLSVEQLCAINQIQSLHQQSFGEFQGCNTGKDIVMVASGPTIKYYEPIPSAIHIGVNNTYKLKDKIKFDYMFAQDYGGGIAKTTINNILQMDCVKFFGYTFGSSINSCTIPESMTYSTRRYVFKSALRSSIFPDIQHYPLMDFNSVIFSAIHFALFTNPKRIYLAGCDVSTDGHFDFVDIKIQEKNIKMMKIGYNRVKEFASIHYPDTEIISINPIGLKGMFTDIFTSNYNE